jgi:hypothetical protein
MLPLGLILLADDIPLLRRARGWALDWMARRKPHWFAGAAGRGEPRGRREAKNRAIRRNRRPLPAIDFMPFLTHL